MKKSRKKQFVTGQEDAFSWEYLRNGGVLIDAYRKTYMTRGRKPATIASAAQRVLANPLVKAHIEKLRERVAKKYELKVGDILEHWAKIALADPNELIQHRRVCCRYCWGAGHGYQWVREAYAVVCAKALQDGKIAPECSGGFDFDAKREPNSDCPICFGEGQGVTHVADTRKLGDCARLLYGGIKIKKNSTEIIFRNQDQALENLAKYLGMFKNKLDDRQPPPVNFNVNLPDDPIAAARIYKKIISEG